LELPKVDLKMEYTNVTIAHFVVDERPMKALKQIAVGLVLYLYGINACKK
jgi:hypothetical protein